MKNILKLSICFLILLNTSCTQTLTVSVQFNPEFAQVLADRGYIKNADNIKLSELEKITELDVSHANLTDLRGILLFKSLVKLNCSYNNIERLLIDENIPNLEYLDVSNNTNLYDLSCDNNQLTNLDISNNTNLHYLSCDNNQLTTLDISTNTNLTSLSCDNNQLTYLDISTNTNLHTLWCKNNPGNGSIFPIKAWFDNNSIPRGFDIFSGKSWEYNGSTITIDFYK